MEMGDIFPDVSNDTSKLPCCSEFLRFLLKLNLIYVSCILEKILKA